METAELLLLRVVKKKEEVNEGGIGSDEGLVSKHTVKKDTHDIIKLMLRNQVKFIHSRG